MAVGDKRNRLYLSNKEVDMSSQSEREGKYRFEIFGYYMIKKGWRGVWAGGRSDAQRLPPMAVGDKRNRLYLSKKKVDMSSQSEREGRYRFEIFGYVDMIKNAAGGGVGQEGAAPPPHGGRRQ